MASDREKQLPFNIRGPLRYVFVQEDSQAQKILSDAAGDLGFPVQPEVDWVDLWTEMQSSFKDHTDRFVSVIERLVTEIVDCAHDVAGADDSFADRLIGGVQEVSAGVGQRYNKRVLYVFVIANPNTKLYEVQWESTAKRRGIVISVSPSAGMRLTEVTKALARTKVQLMFDSKGGSENSQRNTPVVPVLTTANETLNAPVVGVPTRFPTVGDIPSPNVVLSSTPPYLARVFTTGSTITIECSHEPVLTLISQYLEKWHRRNPNDSQNVPFGRVELVESKFGSGNLYEALIIKPYRDRGGMSVEFSDMLPLALLQGPLGFRVFDAKANTTILKRDTPFS